MASLISYSTWPTSRWNIVKICDKTCSCTIGCETPYTCDTSTLFILFYHMHTYCGIRIWLELISRQKPLFVSPHLILPPFKTGNKPTTDAISGSYLARQKRKDSFEGGYDLLKRREREQISVHFPRFSCQNSFTASATRAEQESKMAFFTCGLVCSSISVFHMVSREDFDHQMFRRTVSLTFFPFSCSAKLTVNNNAAGLVSSLPLAPNKECSAARNVSVCLYLFHPTCEQDDDDYALFSSDKNGSRPFSIFDHSSRHYSKWRVWIDDASFQKHMYNSEIQEFIHCLLRHTQVKFGYFALWNTELHHLWVQHLKPLSSPCSMNQMCCWFVVSCWKNQVTF